MSTAFYQQRWEQVISDLLGCVQEENAPLQENKNEKGITYKRTDLEWFQYYGQLYVRYLQVYQKLQDSYDQMIHPQKRVIMKLMLQNVIVRMCEVKQNLIRYSTHTNIIQSDFINIDQILSQMKLTPKVLRVPIPRYYKQTFKQIENTANTLDKSEQIQQIQQIFNWKAQNGKQNLPGNLKTRKFKQKDKDQLRDQLLDQIIKDMGIPEQIQVFNDEIILEANFETIIRIIQKIQRGRQGIVRVQEIMKFRNKTPKERTNVEESQNNHQYVTIQKYWRAFVARRQLARLRNQQLKFLGIQKAPTDKSLLQKAQQTRAKLKRSQQVRTLAFQYKKQKVKFEIQKNQKNLMKAQMQDNRRKWINKFLQIHEFSNLPNNLKQFYEQKQNQQKLNNQKPGQQGQKGNAKQPVKQSKDQNKNKGGKKNEVEKFLDEHISIGPTEAVVNLQKTIQSYSTDWASKGNSGINEQIFDNDIARNQIRPNVEAELQKEVDALISLQLDCMRIKYGIKKKKQKKPKKKKKKEKKVKIPQGLGKRSPQDLLRELFYSNVAKILTPANMQDFIGQHNNLNYLIEKTGEIQPDPSMFQVRNLVAQYVGIPLGSQQAKKRLQKWNWFLFYGPMGTGKTLLTRALQKQTKSIVFDLTPSNVKQQYKQKSQLTKLAWSVIICAKHFQPSIVLIEDFETIFPGSGAKAKKKTNDPSSNFGQKMKKPILDIKKNKLWDKNDRIAVIGCSNKPYDASLKEMKKIFDKKIFFPYPNYPTRKLMFQTFLEKKVGYPMPNFSYNTLAYTTQGFTAGSYLKSIQKVLTKDRKLKLKDQPLKPSEFIIALSNTPCVFSDEFQKFKKFTDEATGLKQRREAKNSKKQDDKKDPKNKPNPKKS